jgi:hypothetical protein
MPHWRHLACVAWITSAVMASMGIRTGRHLVRMPTDVHSEASFSACRIKRVASNLQIQSQGYIHEGEKKKLSYVHCTVWAYPYPKP